MNIPKLELNNRLPLLVAAEYRLERLDTELLIAVRTPDGVLTQGSFMVEADLKVPLDYHDRFLAALNKVQEIQVVAYGEYGARLMGIRDAKEPEVVIPKPEEDSDES